MIPLKIIFFLTLSAFLIGSLAYKPKDQDAIERAILDYVEAFYEADLSKAHRGVAKDLHKRGYYKDQDGDYVEAFMTFEQFLEMASDWNTSAGVTDQSPKKITIFEILDQTASAKVEAHWGIDYFHLAKLDGKWKVVNVLWQTVED
ncbi:nuclear transport factor 2 family protein [Litoribacter populi]|uniref:nuclear transport factor 2 family protein n=1 Tax=Litoribacter populi TaxID=2598460 RepID=UPI00117D21FC|nr:nuclear transport factor 2 family protein [Litoribacter populi]